MRPATDGLNAEVASDAARSISSLSSLSSSCSISGISTINHLNWNATTERSCNRRVLAANDANARRVTGGTRALHTRRHSCNQWLHKVISQLRLKTAAAQKTNMIGRTIPQAQSPASSNISIDRHRYKTVARAVGIDHTRVWSRTVCVHLV
jgi:hypothetical protein